MISLRRQFLLQQLYDSISDKTRVSTRTGISAYSEDEDGVAAVIDTNETFRRSILFGGRRNPQFCTTLNGIETREGLP